MLRRKQPVQSRAIANRMQTISRGIDGKQLSSRAVAMHYSNGLIKGTDTGAAMKLVTAKRISRSRFHVGLSTESIGLAALTMRAALVSDTLLLTHENHEVGHRLGEYTFSGIPNKMYGAASRESIKYGIHCPSLERLGEWILGAERMLKMGLVWYLPNYWTQSLTFNTGYFGRIHAVDYLIRNGRAVDASGAEPIKSQVVRPILQIDLPFIEGVDLRTFSKITADEFDSYVAFRGFLQSSLLAIDDSLNAVQSERELLRLGMDIKDQVRSMRFEMQKARRKGAVSASGALIGSVGAILVAVYGPALQAAIATVGASGGVWSIIHSAAENNTRHLREDKWYYVWALAKESDAGTI
ncbi:hypothetical protein [Streptomyces sp. NPDC057302]|uniref:hypothetical protein n=1 Tax=Streptomyces sp. NPDC057302 TaxID=3346094 RepID=UPI003630B299